MRTRLHFVIRALAMAGLFAAPSGAFAQSTQVAIDRVFAGWDARTSAGCAVGVARGAETIFADAYGMANLEWDIANTPETLFEAGSVSKQFTAGAIVLLVLDGKLSMDDDIRKFVPEVPDYGTPIRIRHLLNHTSGLRDWGSVASISGWGREQRTHTHAHVLDIISRQTALNYPPGAAYSYTNSGYNLLAIIVERVTGQSFAEFSEERIFEPIGLTHTQWRDDYRRIVPGRSTGYSPAGDGYRINQPIEDVHGNGGLVTTVGDLLKWTWAIQDGGFGGEGFEELMHEQGVLTNGRTIFYASGLQIDSYRGTRRVSHTGSTSGYRAYLGHFPDERLSVAILCNAANANPSSLGPAVSDAFLDGPPAEPERPADGISVPTTELATRAGLYREWNTGAPMRLTLENDSLRSNNTVLVPLSRQEFALGASQTRLIFDEGQGGGFRTTEEGFPAGEYIPVPEFEPTPSDLQPYVGEYVSAEAETELRVVEEEGRLVMYRRPDRRMELTPVYPDAFQGPLGLIRFHRGPAGGVLELSVRQERVHDLRFDRR